MSKAIGTDDSINTCECCGKANLKFTVIVLLDNGDTAHYGQVCAARNTSKTPSQIKSEIALEALRIKTAASHELRATPEYAACRARFAQRPRTLLGREAVDFVRDASVALNAVRNSITAKYGLKAYEVQA